MESGWTKLDEKVIQQTKVRRIMQSLRRVWKNIRHRGREDYLLLSEQERRTLVLSLLKQYQHNIGCKALPYLFLLSMIACTATLMLNPYIGLTEIIIMLAVAGRALKLWHAIESSKNNLISLAQNSLDVSLVPFLLDYARRRGQIGFYRNRLEIIGLYLRQLLPQVSPEAADQWTLDQREALTDILSAPFADFDLTLAVLRVIAFAGARSALPRVRFLAGMPDYRITSTMGKSRKENKKNAQWIREAAASCLPLLTARHSGQEALETLLRGSKLDDEQESSQLLRIVDGGLSAHDADLLRPQELDPEAPWIQPVERQMGYDSVSGDEHTHCVRQIRIGSD